MEALETTEQAARAAGTGGQALRPEEIFRAHAADVGRWARRLGGPGIDAEDVVQEVFAKVWEKHAGFRGDSQMTTWLFRITANEVLRRRRRGVWQRLFGGDEEQAEQVASRSPSAHERLEREEEIARLYRALDRLGEKYRVPLVLFEIEELSGERIAELLDLPVATVWVRLHRARARLVQALAGLDREEVAR